MINIIGGVRSFKSLYTDLLYFTGPPSLPDVLLSSLNYHFFSSFVKSDTFFELTFRSPLLYLTTPLILLHTYYHLHVSVITVSYTVFSCLLLLMNTVWHNKGSWLKEGRYPEYESRGQDTERREKVSRPK